MLPYQRHQSAKNGSSIACASGLVTSLSNARCPDRVCSDLEGLRLNDRAHTSASYANVLYIAGGATLATAVVLWFVGAPHEVVVAPVASDRQAGITLTGSF